MYQKSYKKIFNAIKITLKGMNSTFLLYSKKFIVMKTTYSSCYVRDRCQNSKIKFENESIKQKLTIGINHEINATSKQTTCNDNMELKFPSI